MCLIIDIKEGIMANLFKKFFGKEKNNKPVNPPQEVKFLFEDLFIRVQDALNKNEFISKKEFDFVFQPSKTLFDEILPFHQTDMLKEYCRNKGYSLEEISKAINLFVQREEFRKNHNDQFLERGLIENKDYFDQILSKDNPDIILDEEQRRVVLNDEDYCLVIAGAGAGKTTTMAAKVKYLVDKKHVDPSKILVVSFTQKAVGELKERIQGKLGIQAKISTFHSIGNSILRDVNKQQLRVLL